MRALQVASAGVALASVALVGLPGTATAATTQPTASPALVQSLVKNGVPKATAQKLATTWAKGGVWDSMRKGRKPVSSRTTTSQSWRTTRQVFKDGSIRILSTQIGTTQMRASNAGVSVTNCTKQPSPAGTVGFWTGCVAKIDVVAAMEAYKFDYAPNVIMRYYQPRHRFMGPSARLLSERWDTSGMRKSISLVDRYVTSGSDMTLELKVTIVGTRPVATGGDY